MEIREARKLIKTDQIPARIETWCDFGCGTGTFTLALSELLQTGSCIYAVDQDENSLKSIPPEHHGVKIKKHRADFIEDEFPFADLDGILMANSLHYVRDKATFLRKIERYVKTDFRLLIVEYDNETPNAWVPYPLTFQSLTNFFLRNGYSKILKLGERKSIYNRGAMYSALISKQ